VKTGTALKDFSKIIHLHCDHYEPLYSCRNGNDVSVDSVGNWIAEAKRHPFFANTTIFYPSRVIIADMHPDGSFIRQPQLLKSEERILQELSASGFEIQPHIHHDHPLFVALPQEQQSAQYRSLLSSLIPHYRQYARIPEQWFHVHGSWALNASDSRVCNVQDEIRLLMEFGCVGDLSFPAGRSHCDPSLKLPHTVLPVVGVKSYDSAEAQPLRIGQQALQPGRFFVWSSDIPYTALSLDLIATGDTKPKDAFRMWLDGTPIKNVLFIKTHAHSMSRWYWCCEQPHIHVTPCANENVTKAFELLAEFGVKNGIPIEHVGLKSAFEILKELDR